MVAVIALLALTSLQQPARASWIFSTDQVLRNQTMDAWLVVPADAQRAADSLRITLESPARAAVWFRPRSSDCETSSSTGRDTWTGRIAFDTILAVCFRSAAVGRTAVVASIVRGAPSPRRDIIRSETLEVRPRYRVGPGALAVLSATVGLVAGILSHMGQTLWTRRIDDAQKRRDFDRAVFQHLAPEVETNRALLQQYLVGDVAEPPVLQRARYEQLRKDTGLLGYLQQRDRQQYLHRFVRLYRDVRSYNNAVHGRATRQIESRAHLVYDALVALQESNQEDA